MVRLDFNAKPIIVLPIVSLIDMHPKINCEGDPIEGCGRGWINTAILKPAHEAVGDDLETTSGFVINKWSVFKH